MKKGTLKAGQFQSGEMTFRSKEDIENFIKKKLAGYNVQKIAWEGGSSGRAWVTYTGGNIPKGRVGLYVFQFFIKK